MNIEDIATSPCCQRCDHWGRLWWDAERKDEDVRWRFCVQNFPAFAHAEYWCDTYHRTRRRRT